MNRRGLLLSGLFAIIFLFFNYSGQTTAQTPTPTHVPTQMPGPSIAQRHIWPEIVGVSNTHYQLKYDLYYFSSPSSFTFNLPAGVEISNQYSNYTSCNGTWSAPVGGTTFSLSNFTITQPVGCTVRVSVHHTQPGTYNLPPLTVTQNGNTVADSYFTGTIKAYLPATIALSANPTYLAVGDTMNVIYTIGNPR